MLKRILFKPTSTESWITALLIVCLANVYVLLFKPPYMVNVIFVALCITWSAWIFVSIFKGSDELKSASLRYALAAASGVGVPLSLAFVMLMVATPAIQQAISNLASSSGLSPAAAGFGMGVTFMIILLCAVLIISHSIWWASKR